MKIYRKFFIKSPGGGGLIISSPFEAGGGLIHRDGGLIWEEGGLFNLEKTTVSVLHKELENKVHESGEAQEQEGWRLCSRGKKSNPRSVHTKFYSRDW